MLFYDFINLFRHICTGIGMLSIRYSDISQTWWASGHPYRQGSYWQPLVYDCLLENGEIPWQSSWFVFTESFCRRFARQPWWWHRYFGGGEVIKQIHFSELSHSNIWDWSTIYHPHVVLCIWRSGKSIRLLSVVVYVFGLHVSEHFINWHCVFNVLS